MAQEILKSYHSKDSKVHPSVDESVLTIYGSKFCPFTQRCLITLDVKHIPHNFVGIDLLNKPDWYLQICPTGKVPFLKEGDKELTESLVIVNYLDELKQPSIHPTDPYMKARGSLIVDELFPLALTAIKNLKNKEATVEQKIDEIKKALAQLDEKFSQIKTKYLQSDEQPYYADYMTWTALEMIVPVLRTLNYPSFNSEKELTETCPSLAKYLHLMSQSPSIQRICLSPEVLADYYSIL